MKRSRSASPFRVALVAAVCMVATLIPAGPSTAAPAKTSLSISKLTAGRTISLSGKLTRGADSLKAAVLASDPEGDETVPPLDYGLDLGTMTMQADPVREIVTFGFTVHDPFPGLTIGPGFDYLWQIKVDGTDTGKHLQIGNLGGFPPAAGPYFHLCTLVPDGFVCDHQLEGTMEDGTITVSVPFSLLPADPGSVIGTGTSLVEADTLTSSFGMGGVFYFYAIQGETVKALDYTIPGGVRIGIARAGTPVSKVPTTILATLKGSSFSALLPRPRPGLYVVVAKTCFGVKTCVYSSKTVRV
jgi:hypothetical protein